MHARSIPIFTNFLTALDGVLAKTEAHCEANGIAPETLLTFRLFPDMLPFMRQVQLTCDFAARGCDRLSNREMRSFPDTETSFVELRTRIASVIAHIATISPSDFDGAETRTITLKLRSGEMSMSGEMFLEGYAKPQFFFHMTTAYNILRHNGVALGKRDFMGVK